MPTTIFAFRDFARKSLRPVSHDSIGFPSSIVVGRDIVRGLYYTESSDLRRSVRMREPCAVRNRWCTVWQALGGSFLPCAQMLIEGCS